MTRYAAVYYGTLEEVVHRERGERSGRSATLEADQGVCVRAQLTGLYMEVAAAI